MSEKTIAAISTAQGQGGIGVIRISGENSIEVADKVFSSVSGKKLSELKGYTAAYGRVYDEGTLVDEAVALVFRAPHSYTGENTVEISCHGGMYVTRAVLRTILKNGAVPAQAGEFTKRAFLNGKMDLINAEAVMGIIGAKGKVAARAANASKDGALHKKIYDIKDTLIDCAAHLSAWADYPDDDIESLQSAEILSNIDSCINKLETLIKDSDRGKLLCDGIDTVIVGRPNVGKSTLMNLLSGCERSIVTDIPGTTRDIVEETISLGDFILKISDTAGIRDTDNVIEKIGVDKAKQRIQTCELVIAVFDGSIPMSEDDIALIEEIGDIPCIAIINKSDLGRNADIELIGKKIQHTVCLSAKNGTGVDDLINAVEDVFSTKGFDPSSGILNGERQISAAMSALSALKEAQSDLSVGMTFDAVTVSIEYALQALMELTGERTTVEVVDRVFSKFCVGK